MKIRTGKSAAWYAISDIKDRRGNRVYVVGIKRQGLTLSKRFAVSVYGDDQTALQEAQHWRDRVLALLPPTTYRQLRTMVRRNNTSGVPGVNRIVKASGAAFWVAACELENRKKSKSFSVKKHGEEGARQLAMDARQSMLESVPNKMWLATHASQDLSASSCAGQSATTNDTALTWNSQAKEHFLARLREEGLIGQSAAPSPVRRRGYASLGGPLWEASYTTPDGKRIMRRFSIARYGEETAKRLADHAYANMKAEFSMPEPSTPALGLTARLAEEPERLLNVVTQRLALESDAALARKLAVPASTICRVRRRALPLGSALLVRLLEATELHIRELYALTHFDGPTT
jgi:hypothetical protein